MLGVALGLFGLLCNRISSDFQFLFTGLGTTPMLPQNPSAFAFYYLVSFVLFNTIHFESYITLCYFFLLVIIFSALITICDLSDISLMTALKHSTFDSKLSQELRRIVIIETDFEIIH